MSHQSDLIASDILGYLKQHENKDLLRFITCGNVDDGKSTLIGRLLHDSKLIFEDQLAAIAKDSKKYNTTDEEIDLALLVDGLQAEREQGITIDVAYRYFSTDKRKFIIADCPGHEQYTRNMATGASTCDLAIILIDARYGVQTQTRRHSYIVSLLGIKHVLVAVNKMDLVDFSEARFNEIRNEYLAFANQLDIADIRFVPISALRGDNVVSASERTPWYEGGTLMSLLESVEITRDARLDAFRLPVQYVNRPNLDFRGFCGTIAAGQIKPGEEVLALPSGKRSKVKAIVTFEGDQPVAYAGQAITLTLEDEIDVSRGDMLIRSGDVQPQVSQSFDAHVVWMNESPLQAGKEYQFKLAGKSVYGRVRDIRHRIDVNTLAHSPAEKLALNEIALVTIDTTAPVAFDAYTLCRGTGSFIIIDRLTNATAAAGMVVGVATSTLALTDEERVAALTVEIQAAAERYFPGESLQSVLARITS
ncbi:sulfate adenylyltransferase subunit CysN [Silvimonas amylolytica]|uniref:Sulfate adenylyltransferase subunit 1 n=1 Tax=Silvimonas amylolytica TaxID=449663 RepID=A0ABQ2PJX7_9NEIS|nr:sulfate adenylyltransferase subunit CysN [Silvimonas amylolytica]GGP25539.1 sulfate adenylyltransferase subunit 1 [Silvimonas amylolytica]